MQARIALAGPAGSGKTNTALILATALTKTGKIAMIDTELRGNEYADRFAFNRVAVPVAKPAEFSTMATAAAAEGHDVLIVDSFTHFWSGNGGALDMVDTYRDKRQGWSEYRPIENDMMSALLTFPGHVIVTMRVKTNYVTEEQDNGRQKVKKLGLKPDQRESIDYEFSIIGDMDMSHTLSITKTTCPDLVDKVIPRPGAELGETLLAWLGQGEALPTVLEYREQILAAAGNDEALRGLWEEIGRRAMRDAPVLDANGAVSNLGNLIRACKAAKQNTAATALADAAASNGNGAQA
jgi:hypothetical protein